MFSNFVGIPKSRKSTPKSRVAGSKRTQVSKACTLCRKSRSKCDDNNSCSNCCSKGVECVRETAIKAPRYKRRTRLDRSTIVPSQHHKSTLQGSSTSQSPIVRSTSSGWRACTISSSKYASMNYERQIESQLSWKGVKILDPLTKSTQYYGPSSIVTFLNRTSNFLSSIFPEPFPVSKLSMLPCVGLTGHNKPDSSAALPRLQEEMFFIMFWQSYHCLTPILDEDSFKKHYDSLWPSQDNPQIREACPLVDIVLSISILYSRTFIPPSGDRIRLDTLNPKDALYISIWYFRRCNYSLQKILERPSLLAIQCYVFVVIYLRNAKCHTSAYTTLGLAVRIAYSLGLHLEPEANLSLREKEIHRRIWWMLCSLDTEMGLELGRSFAVQMADVTCKMPSDKISSPNTLNEAQPKDVEGITWISYIVERIKLLIVARSAHEEFYSQSQQALRSFHGEDIYTDPSALESCTTLLDRCLPPINQWFNSLSNTLRVARPPPTPNTPQPVIPSWLHLQRLSLHLLHTSILLSLHRPFLSFIPNSQPHLLTTHHTAHLLHNAISLTTHIHTIYIPTPTPILMGWLETYHTLHNTVLLILTYILSHPVPTLSHPTLLTEATSAVRKGIEVLEVFAGNNCPTAIKSVRIMRELELEGMALLWRFRREVEGREGKGKKVGRIEGIEFLMGTRIIGGGVGGEDDVVSNDVNFRDSDETSWPDLRGYDNEMWREFVADLRSQKNYMNSISGK